MNPDREPEHPHPMPAPLRVTIAPHPEAGTSQPTSFPQQHPSSPAGQHHDDNPHPATAPSGSSAAPAPSVITIAPHPEAGRDQPTSFPQQHPSSPSRERYDSGDSHPATAHFGSSAAPAPSGITIAPHPEAGRSQPTSFPQQHPSSPSRERHDSGNPYPATAPFGSSTAPAPLGVTIAPHPEADRSQPTSFLQQHSGGSARQRYDSDNPYPATAPFGSPTNRTPPRNSNGSYPTSIRQRPSGPARQTSTSRERANLDNGGMMAGPHGLGGGANPLPPLPHEIRIGDNRRGDQPISIEPRSGIDWIVPTDEKAMREKTVGERLQPTLVTALAEKNKYAFKAKMTGYALNIAIGLQVLLGALTTGLSAVTTGHQTSIMTAILGGLATVVASYLARARGSNEPELSITRVKDLEQFIRECEAFQMDNGHTFGNRYDAELENLRRRFEELLGNANGERRLAPPV